MDGDMPSARRGTPQSLGSSRQTRRCTTPLRASTVPITPAFLCLLAGELSLEPPELLLPTQLGVDENSA